jgi:hypothetical protein
LADYQVMASDRLKEACDEAYRAGEAKALAGLGEVENFARYNNDTGQHDLVAIRRVLAPAPEVQP